MGTNNAMKNPYLVLLYTLMFIFLSAFTLNLDPTMYIVVFILVTILTFIVRPLEDLYLKSTSYLLLGMLSYWMIAKNLVVSPGGPTPALFTLFALAVLNGLVALISYSGSRMSGQLFTAGALTLMFFDLPNSYSFLSAVLVFAGAHSVVYFISSIKEKREIPERIFKASLLSTIFLYAAAITQLWTGINLGVYQVPGISVVLSSMVYLVAINAFMMLCGISVFEFFLSKFGYARMPKGNEVVYSPAGGRRKQPSGRRRKKR